MPDTLRLMYVDDEADIRTIVEFALEDDFEIALCASGSEALARVAEFRPDLILLDVMMPGMDGPSTLQALRLLPGFEQTPVAFITAKVQPQEVTALKAAGAVGVIAKPFDPMTLSEQVRSLWAQHGHG